MKRLADWAARPRGIDEWARLIVTALVLVGCPLFVLGALHPSKLILDTTPAGGDMGAHVWAPDFLRHHLFSHGRLTGWSPDWYDGFPALTFYFPGPYLAIALLSYLLPYGVAFKLVSVSGVVCLPLAAYVFGRLTGMRFPGPPLLAVATVPFLFDRYFTIWGGNIASTLAGEFAFSISLCLALLFIGVFAKSLETGRYRWLAALLLAGTLLSHLLPTFFAIAGAVFVWLLQPSRRRLGIAVLVGVLGLAIAGFWIVPFAARLGYSNDMGWERTTAFMKGLFPFWCNSRQTDANVNCPAFNVVHAYTVHLKVVVALAAAGVLGGVVLRRRPTVLIAALGATFAAAFRFMPQGTLWNARMLPFWYLCLYLAAAACVSESAIAVAVLLGRTTRPLRDAEGEAGDADGDGDLVALPVDVPDDDPAPAPAPASPAPDPAALHAPDHAPDHDPAPDPDPDDLGDDDGAELIPNRWPAVVAVGAVLLFVLAFVGQSIPDYSGLANLVLGHGSIGGADIRSNQNFVSSWANWNYSGYEQKSAYPEYQDVVATMTRVGRTHGCGRAMWEYESEEDRFGTPMALMLLPKWTTGCIGSQEGLFFESSATVPYHFLNQSELSLAGSRAIRDLPYRDLDVADGIAHLRLLGVRYYMAISPAAQNAADALTTGPSPQLTLVDRTASHPVSYTTNGTSSTQSRTWKVYEIAGSDPVAGLSFEPVVMTGVATGGKGWITASVPWYQDQARWDVMLAASGPANWKRVKGAAASPPRTPVRAAVVSGITMTDDRIAFDVDRPGTPVLVKTSYFPNWQAVGADGPWRVAPNLMVVIPTGTHVELHYGFTPVDNAGRVLSVAGLAVAGLLWRRDVGGGPGDAPPPEGDPEPASVPVSSEDGESPAFPAESLPTDPADVRR